MTKTSRGFRKHLSNSEVLENFVERFTPPQCLPPKGEIKRFWRLASWGIIGGAMATLFPLVSWFQLVPLRYLWIPIGMNGIVFICLAFSFYLAYGKLWNAFGEGKKRLKQHFIGTWDFIALGWIGLFTSLMLLLAAIGALVRLSVRLWIYAVLVYGLVGIGLWAGRMGIVRAMVEGPKAHPWFGAVQLFFSPLSLGVCAVLSGVLRIFVQVMGRKNFVLTTLVLVILAFGLMILFLGLALVAWILAYLHYQKWRGVEELRL